MKNKIERFLELKEKVEILDNEKNKIFNNEKDTILEVDLLLKLERNVGTVYGLTRAKFERDRLKRGKRFKLGDIEITDIEIKEESFKFYFGKEVEDNYGVEISKKNYARLNSYHEELKERVLIKLEKFILDWRLEAC